MVASLPKQQVKFLIVPLLLPVLEEVFVTSVRISEQRDNLYLITRKSKPIKWQLFIGSRHYASWNRFLRWGRAANKDQLRQILMII